MPLRFIAIFWCVSLLMFYLDIFGAYERAPNQILLLLFMVPNVLILLAVDRIKVGVLPAILSSTKGAKGYFRWALGVSLVLLPVNVFIYTGSQLGEFFLLLNDPVEAYARMHLAVSADRSERLGFLLTKMSVSWLTVALVPLAVILHKNRQIGTGTLVFVFSISFILSVFRGTDKELADIMVFLIAAQFISTPKTQKKTRAPFRLLSRQSLLVFAGGLVFLYFFAFRKSERLANLTVHCFQNTNICMEYPSYEVSQLQFLFTLLYRYATHGYYGLSASFGAAFTPCPFIGDSRIMQYIFEIFGMGCEVTITDQLGDLGWTSAGAWSTGFTQLANNFGHMGVYFYILFFAVSLKVFHKTFAERGCYLSGVLYVLNFFILFYMVGNLQMQQVGEQYFGYLALNLIVLFKLSLGKKTSA